MIRHFALIFITLFALLAAPLAAQPKFPELSGRVVDNADILTPEVEARLTAKLEALETQDPLTIKAYQYDMVCNGYELASGSIRNQHPDLMVKAFEITGLTQADVEERFGGMYRAFQFGAPPHGGMAAGVDRMVMLLCGVQNLREITLFPMNQRAEDLLMGAPSPAMAKQLRELNIRVVEQPPKA